MCPGSIIYSKSHKVGPDSARCFGWNQGERCSPIWARPRLARTWKPFTASHGNNLLTCLVTQFHFLHIFLFLSSRLCIARTLKKLVFLAHSQKTKRKRSKKVIFRVFIIARVFDIWSSKGWSKKWSAERDRGGDRVRGLNRKWITNAH